MELLSISRLAWTWWACASRCVKWISVSRSLETATQIPLEKSWEICRKNLVEEIQIGEKKNYCILLEKSRLVLEKTFRVCVIFCAFKITLVFQVLGEDWRCGTWKVFGVPNAFSQGIWESLNPPMTPMKESVNLPRNQVGGGNFCGPQK